MTKRISLLFFIFISLAAGAFARFIPRHGDVLAATQSATYYVRPDGGSPEQCTGLTNAPYPGSGLHQDCAWDHPFRALPPDGPARIQGGDALIIAAGSYRMGYGAPEADGDGDSCASAYPWGCVMPPIPSGPDADHPTRILGEGWDSGCADPPELWGAERADHILDLTDSQHVQIACLEITDHAGCVEFHSGDIACPREGYPYGDWAPTGLYAQDASDIHLQDLNIHGLAHTGVWAGRLRDWEVTNVRIAGNGWVGWDGDIDGDDSNSGRLQFRLWTVEWNGCGETWPDGEPIGCWAQSAGGYGDGVGTGATGGDWIIEDSAFLHNTSDGLDLLYHTGGGGITLTNVRAEGNAGNQIKTTGAVTLTNSVLVGNCAYFDDQPFTYNVDPCRALGNTLSLSFMGGEVITLTNNSLYGQGDGLIEAGSHPDGACTGSERITGRNNLYQGDDDYFQPGDVTFLFYAEDCPGLTFDSDYSLYDHIKLSAYTPGPHDIEADPQLAGPLSGDYYGMDITATSPARDAGLADVAPATDFLHLSRDASPDIGAYEYQPNPIYLPQVTIAKLNASDIRLTWERPDDAYARFHVFRSSQPYFQPDGSATAVIDAPPWQWDDPAALGDPAQNHYYLVQGERFDHGHTDSNRVGEFDFALTPGSATIATRPGGYATGAAENQEEMDWMGRFHAVETGGVADPISLDKVDALRADGVQTLFLYEWMPAGYHYLDDPTADDPFMQWAYTHRYTATLNADGPFPHCQEEGYDWCEDYYYDLAIPEVRDRRVDYLVNAVQDAGHDGLFFDWATGGFLEEPAFASIKQEYESRHPDIPYDQAVADFYQALKDRGMILHTNQGFRSAEYILPITHYDMTESYVTDYEERGNQLYLQGQGLIDIPETLYYPLSDDEYDGNIQDTIDYLDYLADLRAQYAGPDFIATVYMNYAAPDFVPTGEIIDGHDVYTATIPRNAIYWGTAIPWLLNQIAYTETPWDHRYERDDKAPYFYDLGDPLGDGYETIQEGSVTYYVRYYSQGVVLAGEWPGETTLTLSSAYIPSHQPVYDPYEDAWLTTGDHTLTVTLRPQAISPFNSRMAPLGRIYAYGQ